MRQNAVALSTFLARPSSVSMRRFALRIVIASSALGAAACGDPQAQLQKQRQAVQSCRETTRIVAHAWVAHEVSAGFARVAFDRAYQLAEQTRHELTESPRSLADRQTAALTQECEELSRLIARLRASIDVGDPQAAERLLP